MSFPRLFPSKAECQCVADKTFETSVQKVRRGRPSQVKRAKQVFHWRSGIGYFWHWSDVEVVTI